MHDVLAAIDRVECPLPRGAFDVFPDVRRRLERPVAGKAVATSPELCDLLLDEAKIALVPGDAFGAPGHVPVVRALRRRSGERVDPHRHGAAIIFRVRAG